MKDVLTGLSAVMAALATLAAILVSTDVTKQQNKLVDEQGLDIDKAFTRAQRTAAFHRYILLMLPCLAALVFSVAALFVHSPPT